MDQRQRGDQGAGGESAESDIMSVALPDKNEEERGSQNETMVIIGLPWTPKQLEDYFMELLTVDDIQQWFFDEQVVCVEVLNEKVVWDSFQKATLSTCRICKQNWCEHQLSVSRERERKHLLAVHKVEVIEDVKKDVVQPTDTTTDLMELLNVYHAEKQDDSGGGDLESHSLDATGSLTGSTGQFNSLISTSTDLEETKRQIYRFRMQDLLSHLDFKKRNSLAPIACPSPLQGLASSVSISDESNGDACNPASFVCSSSKWQNGTYSSSKSSSMSGGSHCKQQTYLGYESATEYENSDDSLELPQDLVSAHSLPPPPDMTNSTFVEDEVTLPQPPLLECKRSAPEGLLSEFLVMLQELDERHLKDKEELYRKFGLAVENPLIKTNKP